MKIQELARASETQPTPITKHIAVDPGLEDIWEDVPRACATIVSSFEQTRQLGIAFLTVELPSPSTLTHFPEMPKLVEALAERVRGDEGRFLCIGKREEMPENFREAVTVAEKETRGSSGQTLIFALQGGWRDEVVQGAQRAVTMVHNLRWQSAAINEALLSEQFPHHFPKEIPEIDFVLHMGIPQDQNNGFTITDGLNWHRRYAEDIISHEPFYALSSKHVLEQAIHEFSQRKRNFGGRINPV